VLDCLTTSVFAIEAILKIVSFGFIFNGSQSYLKNPWNFLDFIIVVLSILAITPITDQLKLFKMFRVLKGLRIISKNESLKVGVKSLLYALPSIMSVTVIMLFFFSIFSIICVSYFKGKFYICS
jgi:hypothetical protein